jgi:hypothetical protein
MKGYVSTTAFLTILGLAAAYSTTIAEAQQLTIASVSIARLGTQNLCGTLGGAGQPPTITIKHSKAGGSLSLSMIDRLNNGNTVNHGSTTASASPSGTTVVTHNFLPPCNRKTAEGLKSAYYVTVAAGSDSKTVLWGRYP